MEPVSRRNLLGSTVAVAATALSQTGAARGAEPATESKPTAKRDWWDREFKTLVTLGESTTAGGSASCRERAWAHQLVRAINEFQRVPAQLVNVGIGANVISRRSPTYERSGKPAALERLDKHVIRHTPDLLVVSYGLNDARGGTPLDLFTAEMRTLVDRVRAELQPLIVLLGPYYMTGFENYGPDWDNASLELFHKFNDSIREVAEQKACLFVDLLASYNNADWLIHHDTVHANDLGHRIVANKIFETLASNCSGMALETQQLERHFKPWRDESVLRADANE